MATLVAYSVADDETVLEAARSVLRDQGHVETQHRLVHLVRQQLARRDPSLTVGQRRLRRLVLEAGLADLTVATGRTDRPAPDTCPVCHADLEPVRNRTLDGGETMVGTRCPACPYETGRTREVPLRYGFEATERDVPRTGPF